MKKVTGALAGAAAVAAVTIGLAAPAMAAPVGADHGGFPQDCSVHVLYQGSNVDVNWC
jgi:hypothetical protein